MIGFAGTLRQNNLHDIAIVNIAFGPIDRSFELILWELGNSRFRMNRLFGWNINRLA